MGTRGREGDAPPCRCATGRKTRSSSVSLTCAPLSINPARHESHSQVISISLPHMLSGVASAYHQTASLLWQTFSFFFFSSVAGFGKLQSALQMPCLSSEHGGKSSGVRLPGGRVHRGAFRRGPGGYRCVCSESKRDAVTFCLFVRTSVGRANDDCHVGEGSANRSYAM